MYFYLWNQWQILPEKSLIRKYRLSFKIPGYLICGRSSLAGKKKSSTMKQIYIDGTCYEAGKKAVLTNGFIKKSQKTPKAEKELAKKYKADYERNKKSQPEYSEKTCTGIRDAIKAGICSDANKK